MKLFILFYLSHSLLCTPVYGDHDGQQDDDRDHQDTEAKTIDQIAQDSVRISDQLFAHLTAAHPNKNILFSPLAISDALSFLFRNDKSKTLQVGDGLSFQNPSASEETNNEGDQELLNIVNQPDSDPKVDVTNNLFIDNNVKPLDFQNIEEAAKLEKSNGKMEDSLNNLDPQTVPVLVNTISFKW
ncbi:serpin A3-5-like isoform X2 [Hyla sarda]|nr:serpin A3-5-like isoform X2 [Hyla sarda]